MQKNTSYNIGSFQAERSLIIYLDYLRKSEFLSAKKILLSFFYREINYIQGKYSDIID